MKYYFISGETSGDQHASELIKALKTNEDDQFRGIGGSSSLNAGLEIVIKQEELAFMGFIEVLKNLSTIRKAISSIKADLRNWQPDALVLVDYPGFNLRIAKYAHSLGIPVHYYIAPKVWAWNEKRIKKIKAYVDQLYCILPFEESYFKNAGINAKYVGNPSWQKVRTFNRSGSEDKDIIALLPGSRKQEIKMVLPVMLDVMKKLNRKYAIAKAPGLDRDLYASIAPDLELEEDMYQLLSRSKAALVTSGTATLETALLNVPQLVCYKTSTITYQLAKRFIKLPYISLVNIILNKHAVVELIQDELNERTILSELEPLISETEERNKLLEDYNQLKELIGDSNPAEETAKLIKGS